MAISREQALDCLRSTDLIGIGMEADAVRRRLHPEGVVTYAVESTVTLTNRPHDSILAEIVALESSGASGIVLTGLHDSLDALATLLTAIRRRTPDISLRGFSAADLAPESLAGLHAAGLDSIGTSAPETPDAAWLAFHQAAHRAGMTTSARIVFGAGESPEQFLDQLEAIRNLQSETGGFAALAPVSFHAVGGRELDETTAVEFLKTLAVARMFVDTIPNLESDWTTQGLKVLQMGLRFGANDVGSAAPRAPEEELRRLIRDAGFRPAHRHPTFRALMLA